MGRYAVEACEENVYAICSSWFCSFGSRRICASTGHDIGRTRARRRAGARFRCPTRLLLHKERLASRPL